MKNRKLEIPKVLIGDILTQKKMRSILGGIIKLKKSVFRKHLGLLYFDAKNEVFHAPYGLKFNFEFS